MINCIIKRERRGVDASSVCAHRLYSASRSGQVRRVSFTKAQLKNQKNIITNHIQLFFCILNKIILFIHLL